jgi:hypothetical protein
MREINEVRRYDGLRRHDTRVKFQSTGSYIQKFVRKEDIERDSEHGDLLGLRSFFSK